MAQITGQQYIQKYGYMPPGTTYTSMIEDAAPTNSVRPSTGAGTPEQAQYGQYQQFNQPTRTLDANTYVSNVNNPQSYDVRGEIQKLLTNMDTQQATYLDAVKNRPSMIDTLQKYLTQFDVTGLAERQKGLLDQSNTLENTLRALPTQVVRNAQDVGISQGQADRITAKESTPILQAIKDALFGANTLGGQIAANQGQAQLYTNLAGQDEEAKLSALGLPLQLNTSRAGLLGQLADVLNPKPEKLATQVVSIGGRELLIDTQTGQTIKDLGATPKSGGGGGLDLSSIFGGAKLSPQQKGLVADTQSVLDNIQTIQGSLGSVNTGPLAGIFNSLFGKSPNQSDYRKGAIQLQANIEQLRANFQKALSGAAVSEQEAKRLAKFLPNINDQEGVIRSKLAAINQAMTTLLNNTFTTAGGDYSKSVFGGASSGINTNPLGL